MLLKETVNEAYDSPVGAVGLVTSGHVMRGSFSSRSTSSMALDHCFMSPLLVVHAVGSLAEPMTAAMWNCMSLQLGR